jgi:hypothetical protein
VDTGFVRERVVSNDGLVGLNGHSRNFTQEAAGRVQFFGIDRGVNAIELFPHLERHDNLFEGRIARAFADTVDGALDLPDSVLNSRQ